MRPLILAALIPLSAAAQDANDPNYNAELGLYYSAPGRGVTDHEALRRRVLEVLQDQFGTFLDKTETLKDTAAAYCAGDADKPTLIAATKEAWLAWAPLDSYQFGPMEHTGAALSIDFWPDKKGFVARGIGQILTLPEDQQASAEGIATGSAAAQGFPALAHLLTEESLPDCPAAQGIAANLHRLASDVNDAWFNADGWADLARSAGPENPVYLTPEEFTAEIYTAMDFALERMGDQRVRNALDAGGNPRRVDGHRLQLGSAILHAQLAGLEEMIAKGFAGDVRDPSRAWVLDVAQQAHDRIDRLGMPLSTAVTDLDGRWRAEAVVNKFNYLADQMARDIGPDLGVDTGFTPADGD